MTSQGTLTEMEGSGTVDLLIKIACFVTKVNSVFNIKMSKNVNRTEPSPSVRVPWTSINNLMVLLIPVISWRVLITIVA